MGLLWYQLGRQSSKRRHHLSGIFSSGEWDLYIRVAHAFEAFLFSVKSKPWTNGVLSEESNIDPADLDIGGNSFHFLAVAFLCILTGLLKVMYAVIDSDFRWKI